MKRRAAAALLLLVLLAGGASADPSPQGCIRPIHVAARPSGRLIKVSPTGEISGPFPEFLAGIARTTGCTFLFEPVSTARAFVLLTEGETDVTVGARTPDRDRTARFVHFFSDRPVLLTLGPEHPAVHSVDQLVASGLSVGIVRGNDYGSAYRALIASPRMAGRIHEAVGPNATAQELAAGRIDAALATAGFMIDAIKDARVDDRVVATPLDGLPGIEAGAYLAATLPAADRDRLARAMAEAVRRGTFEAILRRSQAASPWTLDGVEFDGAAAHPAAE